MRFCLLPFLLVALLYLLSSTEVQAQFDFQKIINHEKQGHKGFLKSPPKQAGQFIDVHYYRLRLEVDPEVKYIKGAITTYFTATKDKLNKVSLNMSNTLLLDSAKRGNETVKALKINQEVRLDLVDTLNAGDLDSLTIFYQGVPPTNGLGTFTQSSYNGIDSIIWTLSQPYGASEWWPCKNDLKDKADSVDIQITTTLGNQVASNGLLKKVDTSVNQHTFYWESRYPIATYLIAFAVTNYEVYQDTLHIRNKDLLLQHFQYPGDTVGIFNSLEYIDEFLIFYDSLFGEYPFIKEKYGHASCPFGGGMEHQTMSFMGGYGGEIMAHELAHQWFGNKVTCQSWKDLWLNEGFATYLTAITYDFSVVHDPYYWPIFLDGMQRAAFNYPHGSVYRPDTTNVQELFNGLVYHKGGYLLHMLRFQIGDSLFFQTLSNYVNDPQLTYGFASTQDFKRHLEQTTQRNFDEFFKDWFYGKGFPIYGIEWEQEGNELRLTITQTQTDPSVYFFDSPVPLKLFSNQWDSTLVLNPKFSGDQFSLPVNRQIDSIQFDPELWVLAKADIITDQKDYPLTHQLKIYPNPSKGFIQLECHRILVGADFSVLNPQGKVIKRGKTESSFTLDFSKQSRGVYFFRLDQFNLTKKLKIF
ncbi:MAG: M1 family aminopeptidase [Vicingaceae bacterium]